MGRDTKIQISADNTNTPFQIGEKIIHIPEGVCIITEIVKMQNFGEIKDYYKLVPVMDNTSAIYVSTNSPPKYVRKLRSKEEIQEIIDASKKSGTHWERNEDKRITQMKTAIQNDDGIALAKLIKSYYQKRKQERLKINDCNMLKKAEQLLFSEMAEVLHIDYKHARTQIL